MRGCFGGFWRRRVRLTGWRSGFRATVCRCAGRLWCTGWRVRILWCRSICEGVGRGGGKPLFFCLSEPADIFVKRTQTTQTRLTAQQRVALAYGELLPQPRLSVASSLYQKRPQSGCGMREPEARSYNTTAGRVGAARRQAGATGRSSRRLRLCGLCSFSKYIRWFAYTAITKC